MKVVVIGKEHRQGKAKRSGNEYNANIVHFLVRARGLEGHRGDSAWLDPDIFPLDEIEVGGTYVIDFNGRGFVQDFYPSEG